ncbi:MAG: pseudouridine synthase [Puniceicoccaceae bacterium]
MNVEPLQILYQDDYYIAVHKPAGLLVHRSRIDAGEHRFCLQLLRDQIGKPVHPCHRLDKPTSGVLLFALDKESLGLGSALFKARTTRKIYHAVVRGWTEEADVIDHPLSYKEEGRTLRGGGEPQEARTAYRRLRQFEINQPVGEFPTARYSELELVPASGRMHQLRRHMKHIHHPIIGDTRYGDGFHNRLFREKFDSHRLLLVASSLEFMHPITEKMVQITRGVDLEFDNVLQKLSLRA